MRRITLVFMVLGAEAWAATVSGTVLLKQEESRRPLAGARVSLRRSDGALVQANTTDNLGRYTFTDIRPGRFSVSASRQGLCARAVSSAEPSLTFQFDTSRDSIQADFEMAPGGVVSGRITDLWNEPLEKVAVLLYRADSSAGTEAAPSATADSDDQGLYRLFGLEPGRYTLVARLRQRMNDDPAEIYYPGAADRAQARPLEISMGTEVTGIDLAMRPEPTFRITGKVASPSTGSRIHVQLVRTEQSQISPGVAPVTAEGEFVLSGVRAGRYVLRAVAQPAAGGIPRAVAREIVAVTSDVSGLVLRPTAPGRVEGKLIVRPPKSSRTAPESIRIRLSEAGLTPPLFAVARAPDYRFEFPEIWTGSYTAEAVSPAGVYLRQPAEIIVKADSAVRIELEAGLDQAVLAGLVKAPGSSAPCPHARVALARPGTNPVEFRAVQADQHGRFLIPDVQPGEYLVAAWKGVDTVRLYETPAWQRAKKIGIEPNVEIDLELTAAP